MVSDAATLSSPERGGGLGAGGERALEIERERAAVASENEARLRTALSEVMVELERERSERRRLESLLAEARTQGSCSAVTAAIRERNRFHGTQSAVKWPRLHSLAYEYHVT